MVASRVRVARQRMTNYDDIAVVCCSRTVGLVGHLDGREGLARVEHQRVVVGEEDDPPGLDRPEGAWRVADRSHRGYAVALARAWSRSAMMSAIFSMPTDRRTRS